MVFSLVISCDTVIKFIRSVPYQFLNILASSAIHATKPQSRAYLDVIVFNAIFGKIQAIEYQENKVFVILPFLRPL